MNNHYTAMDVQINKCSTNFILSILLFVPVVMALSACGGGGGGGSTATANSIPTPQPQPQPADLVVSVVTASPAVVGQNVTLTATISNIGDLTSGDFDIDLYKDLASPPAAGQRGDITCNASGLAGGASTNCSGTVTYPAAGTDMAWAQVDTQNIAAESNELNNIGQVGLVVIPSGVIGITAANCINDVPRAYFFTVDPSVFLPSSIMIGYGTVILANVTLGGNIDIGACAAIGDGTNALNIGSSTIGDGTTIRGISSITAGANVGNAVTIVGSDVAGRTDVGANSSLSGASLGTKVKLGIGSSIIRSSIGGSSILGINDSLTGATLGSNVHLGNQVIVGNNVSISGGTYVGTYIILKKVIYRAGPTAYIGSYVTTIQHGTFVGGSAKIGIGATIGANAKIMHSVVIDSGVMIGAGAYIGAGLHICSNVPAGVSLRGNYIDGGCK